MNSKIHPTAVVDPGASIGSNVTIRAYAVIEKDVTIGDDCEIGYHAVLSSGTVLGNGVRVFAGALIGGEPQDIKYKGEPTGLEIGDMTVIRECVTLNRGTTGTGKSKIGKNCLIMAYSHVAHDCYVGNNVIMANSVNLAGYVNIHDNVIIGGLTGIHQFVTIGTGVMVGGMFRVTKDIPPFILAGGNPLSFEGLNSIGLRRRGFSPNTIQSIADAYHIIYKSNLNVSQALQKLGAADEQAPEVKTIIEFIQNSKRGIVPAKNR